MLLARIGKDASFAQSLLARMAGQVQGYRRRLEIGAIRSARERVLVALADGWLTGTILEFAADIGLTHEATYRALADLVRENRVLKTGRGSYEPLVVKPPPGRLATP